MLISVRLKGLKTMSFEPTRISSLSCAKELHKGPMSHIFGVISNSQKFLNGNVKITVQF